MNLQEQISRIQEMMGTINESNFFSRRVDLDEFKNTIKLGVGYTFYDSNSLEIFKHKLLEATLSNYIYYKYNIEIFDELDGDDIENFVNKLKKIFGDLVTGYYNDFKKYGGLREDIPDNNLQEGIEENNKVKNYLFRRIDPDTLETIIDTNYKFAEKEYDETFSLNDFHYGVINIILEDLHNYDYIDFHEYKGLYNELRNYLSEVLLERTRKLYNGLSQE
jgi:hypothetical protein